MEGSVLSFLKAEWKVSATQAEPLVIHTLNILSITLAFVSNLGREFYPGLPSERTWCRLFQKRVVRTKFDIYVFVTITGSISLLMDY
jgi:hypothetical protein